MIFKILKTSTFGVLISLLFACNYNSSVMMQTPRGYKFDTPPTDTISEYILTTSDIITFSLYTNNGTSLIDLTAITDNQKQVFNNNNFSYLIESGGFVRLPIIGSVKLSGKTIKEAEKFLEEEYQKYYIKPFVKLNITNRRITVFPGGGSKGRVIPLKNENMTMLEALGQVGGLTKDAKAYKIKLIRGNLKDPKVYMFDFSTLEGIKKANFVLQANDIIYVENKSGIYRELTRDMLPLISLLTSAATLIVVLNALTR